ncbi:MAG: hypothetical protein A3H35_13685 [Betaproteobacteria bacterium RIFCSPLOWO2_02_FULL_62_17]|nr:MAG: hypothetical protein A3H35_13685 [Betaproteobacteria bacterium RIFCSPLOWO2_02_FULL_62_17]
MTAAVSEYSEVEQPFLLQLAEPVWTTIDQGTGIPQDPKSSLRANFRQWLLPAVFNDAIQTINRKVLPDYLELKEWLRQRGPALDL